MQRYYFFTLYQKENPNNHDIYIEFILYLS